MHIDIFRLLANAATADDTTFLGNSSSNIVTIRMVSGGDENPSMITLTGSVDTLPIPVELTSGGSDSPMISLVGDVTPSKLDVQCTSGGDSLYVMLFGSETPSLLTPTIDNDATGTLSSLYDNISTLPMSFKRSDIMYGFGGGVMSFTKGSQE